MIEAVDHLGNRYPSVNHMALEYGVYPTCLIYQRINKLGWSLERALTTPVRHMKTIVYQGRKYRSTRELCLATGVDTHTLDRRLARGFSVEDAIKTGHDRLDCIRAVDHLGNEYPSMRAMARAYGKSPDVIAQRLERGYSIEVALTAKRLVGKRKPYGKRTRNKDTQA